MKTNELNQQEMQEINGGMSVAPAPQPSPDSPMAAQPATTLDPTGGGAQQIDMADTAAPASLEPAITHPNYIR